MRNLELTVCDRAGNHPLLFPVRRVVNAGYVGRNQDAVRAHIEELAREGIPLFPFLSANLTTAGEIEVIGGTTSGEVEYVLLLDGGEIFVGVGSDHTDRALERDSIVKSKQICANVLSREVWRHDEVKPHWDDLVLRSWVRQTATDAEVLYQEARLATILSAEALLALVRSRVSDDRHDGMVIYSGTIPLKSGHTIYGETFRAELFDPVLGRSLSCVYRAVQLTYVEGMD
jgi:hypothetical protein